MFKEIQFYEELEPSNKNELDWWYQAIKRHEKQFYEGWPKGVEITYPLPSDLKCICFKSEEGVEQADLEALGKLIHTFMIETGCQNTFRLVWAQTCSEKRTGLIGGGFMVVSRNGVVIKGLRELARQETLTHG